MSLLGLHRTASVLIASLCFLSASYAQSGTVGTTYSFGGVGVLYEHDSGNSMFELRGRVELGEVFMNRTDIPGFSVSFIRNYIIKEWKSEEGDMVRLICGPGISAGWGYDYMEDKGLHIGLAGRIGLSCLYRRNIRLSICLSPVIGTHLKGLESNVKMGYYRYGLLGALMPEIGIGYSF